MKGFQAARLEKLARELGLDDAVEFTGWIPRERLYELFRGAAAFVYPSTFEGFGMPVLEALAAGLPTACSGIPVLREVAGDAALFFDPLSDDALVAALHNITTDEALRNRLRQEGPRRARGFTWEAAAAKTMAVLEEAAAQRSRSSN